ncbi:hypothetical protein [Campylobacter troglodytis]|uniref:hypothetical protein n=1 Tax=Campylobacter troglodytis TaxID=654363 RepID=UPI00163C46E6|nr:hypothetical protein [Campylobacter troglodytis]
MNFMDRHDFAKRNLAMTTHPTQRVARRSRNKNPLRKRGGFTCGCGLPRSRAELVQ